jgi:uncharacterized protein involved in exopolysaccharide biosynthesis
MQETGRLMIAADEPPDRFESLNLIEIWYVIWRHRWWVLGFCALSVAATTVYTFTAKSWYRAEVLLKPVEDKSSKQGLGGMGGLGALAGLAGINVGSNPSAEPLAVLTSRAFSAAFIEDLDLLPLLFPKRWDPVNKRWKSSVLSGQPDIRDGVRYFDKKILGVREDRKNGFITLSIDWTDPKVAAVWANLLVERLNDRMRTRALAQAETNVTYLKEEMASSNIVTLQQSIGRVLENELQDLMLARVNKEYSFTVIDPAETPKWRIFPQRLLLVSLSFIMSVIISSVFFVTRYVIRRNVAWTEHLRRKAS